jgi:hypothetical protein
MRYPFKLGWTVHHLCKQCDRNFVFDETYRFEGWGLERAVALLVLAAIVLNGFWKNLTEMIFGPEEPETSRGKVEVIRRYSRPEWTDHLAEELRSLAVDGRAPRDHCQQVRNIPGLSKS